MSNIPKEENWVWSKKKLQAVELIASDEYTYKQIQEKLGVYPATLSGWRAIPEFKRKVEEISKEISASVRKFSISKKHNRLAALNKRWKGLHQIIDERAIDPDMADIPGGKTGLVVLQKKQIGAGRMAEVIEEYILDGGILKELRAHEEQAARELGEWVDQANVVNTNLNVGTAPVDLANMTVEELESLDKLFRTIESRRGKPGASNP